MIAQQLRQRKRYRTELKVVTQILQIIKQKGSGIILTNIQTQAQIGHDETLNLLNKLITAGIVSKEVAIVSHIQTKGRKIYKLTQNGYTFLAELENFFDRLKNYNLEITI